MLQSLIANLQDPVYEAALLSLVVTATACVMLIRRRQLSIAALVKWANGRRGSIELQNQSWSGTITIIALAVGGVFGYMIYTAILTGLCGSTLSKIATANDLRLQYGQGYEANGAVTAAAIVDAYGNTYGITTNPRDWAAAASSATYTWNAAQTNGNWAYTVTCPGSHAGWTTVLLPGGGVSSTTLLWKGPNGSLSAT